MVRLLTALAVLAAVLAVFGPASPPAWGSAEPSPACATPAQLKLFLCGAPSVAPTATMPLPSLHPPTKPAGPAAPSTATPTATLAKAPRLRDGDAASPTPRVTSTAPPPMPATANLSATATLSATPSPTATGTATATATATATGVRPSLTPVPPTPVPPTPV